MSFLQFFSRTRRPRVSGPLEQKPGTKHYSEISAAFFVKDGLANMDLFAAALFVLGP